MRRRFILLFLMIIYSFLGGYNAFADLTIDSWVVFFSQGFKVDRPASNTSIDRITVPEISISGIYTNNQKFSLKASYRYNYLTQSQLSSGIIYKNEKILISGGIFLGFFNELPLYTVPGMYSEIRVFITPVLNFSLDGASSFFLRPLFSLSPRSYNFDQNRLRLELVYRGDNVDLMLAYDNENIYRTKSSQETRDGKKRYEFVIQTRVPKSWVNSRSALGGDVSDFKQSSVQQQFVQCYISERLNFIIGKSTNFLLGVRTNILNFTLKDIKSTDPPKTPSFVIEGGFTHIFVSR